MANPIPTQYNTPQVQAFNSFLNNAKTSGTVNNSSNSAVEYRDPNPAPGSVYAPKVVNGQEFDAQTGQLIKYLPPSTSTTDTPSVNAGNIGTQSSMQFANHSNQTSINAANYVNSIPDSTYAISADDTPDVATAKVNANSKQGILNKLSGMFNLTQEQQNLESQYNIPSITAQLNQEKMKLTQLKSSFDSQRNVTENQAIPTPFIIGQTNEINKTAAIELGAQAAVVEALQGNLDLAQHYVDKAIDLEYKDFQIQYDNAKYNFENAKDFLNATEKKQADKLSQQWDMQKIETEKFLDAKSSLAKEALVKGQPTVARDIMASKDWNDLTTNTRGVVLTKPSTNKTVASSYTKTDAIQADKILNSGTTINGQVYNGRGSDGYVDPGLYITMYNHAAQMGLGNQFIKAHPPKNYINPKANSILPTYLQNTTKTASSRSI